jgi:hypothetical protein
MIAKFRNFVKQHQSKIILISIFILSLSASFLGGVILGANILRRPPIAIDKNLVVDLNSVNDSALTQEGISSNDSNSSLSAGLVDKRFVASKRGKYYYPVDCSLANSLKEENKIYFSSEEEAQKQGYIFNSRCGNK